MGGMRHECEVWAEDLGPYLLGQLPAPEAARVAALVADCPTCTVEVERLRPVVQALGTMPLPAAGPALPAVLEPPAPALDRVLAEVQAHTQTQTQARTADVAPVRAARRPGRRVAVLAAASLLVVAGALAVLLGRGGEVRTVTLARADTAPGQAAGSVEVVSRSWGTALTVEVRGLRPGRTYGAWLADESGQRTPAGTFRAATDGTAELELGASLALDDVGSLGVTQLGGDDVLTADL